MTAEKWNFYFRLILGILNHRPFAAGLCINETLSYDNFFFNLMKRWRSLGNRCSGRKLAPLSGCSLNN